MTTQTTPAQQPSHISDYERAVCYYALSRPSGNVTLALILVYALCVLEAALALVYGFMSDDNIITTVGIIALAGIILFGVVAFMARALNAEIQRRRALAIAMNAPDPETFQELPDPFADHALLLRPVDEGQRGFDVKDHDGRTVYTVQMEDGGATRRVLDPDGTERLVVKITAFASSFAIEGMSPRRAEVHTPQGQVATIRRRFTLGSPAVDVFEGQGRDLKRYSLRDGGVYRNSRLVGRVYLLRDSAYLDVEQSALGNGLLGLFAALSYEKARTALL